MEQDEKGSEIGVRQVERGEKRMEIDVRQVEQGEKRFEIDVWSEPSSALTRRTLGHFLKVFAGLQLWDETVCYGMQPRHTTKTTDRLKQEGAPLAGKKIAILVADGFEQSELVEPRNALKDAGADTFVISPAKGKVMGWKDKDWGDTIAIDQPLDKANADDFDALLLPGGVMNPDTLRSSEKAVQFVRKFFEQHKPVAAICHGPWTLIDAGVVKGRSVTSYHSIRSDLLNAGAKWVDQEVVVDNGLVTSRQPSDIPAFNRKMIEEFAEGKHEQQVAGVATGAPEVPVI